VRSSRRCSKTDPGRFFLELCYERTAFVREFMKNDRFDPNLLKKAHNRLERPLIAPVNDERCAWIFDRSIILRGGYGLAIRKFEFLLQEENSLT